METPIRIGIIGCGQAARIHARRLSAVPEARVVGCSDLTLDLARALSDQVSVSDVVPAFGDHRELLRQTAPAAVAIFTPHLFHYRPAMDALQADCHVFIEKPLSTNVQEAADIANLARARARKVGVGHQYRLLPSLQRARALVADRAVGNIHLISAMLAAPWWVKHGGPEDAWRLDPSTAAGGILADAGDHLLDAILWITGATAAEAAGFQTRCDHGPDLVTAAAVRLSGGIFVSLGISGLSSNSLFEIHILGDSGCLRATDNTLWRTGANGSTEAIAASEPSENIDANFLAAIGRNSPLCCPVEDAVETVRLLEAISRSAATGQVVRLA
jgi:predicted dehydrogenase